MSLPQILLCSALDFLFKKPKQIVNTPNNSIEHQHRPRPARDLFDLVHAAPCIHRRVPAHEAPPAGLVGEGDVVSLDVLLLGKLGELLAEVLSLLRGHLGGL